MNTFRVVKFLNKLCFELLLLEITKINKYHVKSQSHRVVGAKKLDYIPEKKKTKKKTLLIQILRK